MSDNILKIDGIKCVRIVCDCCGSSYEDYILTKDNEGTKLKYLCSMCNEYVEQSIQNNEKYTRNTLDELKEMKKNHMSFIANNECIDCGNL